MLFVQQLISFHVIEKDKNNVILMTSTFPTINTENKELIIRKSTLELSKKGSFTYFRNKTQWMYLTTTETFACDKLKNVDVFALVLIAVDYNPHKYETLGRILSKCYCKSGSPVELVKLYLSVCTTGSCSTQENGMFMLKEFDKLENENTIKLKELITGFGMEFMIIYNAMLLKKRVIIYHHSPETLLQVLYSLHFLVSHRNTIDYLYPQVDMNSQDYNELKNSRCFLAACTDSSICTKNDLYDVLMNLPATEIEIASHAKDQLAMTKIQKTIIMSLVQLAENSETKESQIVEEIRTINSGLLEKLRNFSPDGCSLRQDDLKSKNLSVNVVNFLYNLAVAENMAVIQ